jgi:hypothetical protein
MESFCTRTRVTSRPSSRDFVINPIPGELWEAPEYQRMKASVAEHALVLRVEDIVVYLDDDDMNETLITKVTYYDTGFDKVHTCTLEEFNNIFVRVIH